MNLYKAFVETAARFAGRLALSEGERQLTYQEMVHAIEARSSVWRGEPSAHAVILALPKSANFVLWQLAANAHNMVFVPMDPALPEARRVSMVDIAQPRWQVTEPHTTPSGAGWSLHAAQNESWLWRRAGAKRYDSTVSHIYFSSGSTGRPKAILLSSAPVVSVVKQQAEALGVNEFSRFAWLLQAGFDASLSDCYQSLLSGAALFISTTAMTQRKTIRDFLRTENISHTDIPPSLLPVLKPGDFPELKGVIFGGELARASVVQEWVAAGIRMFNAYGPTETTICTSLKEVGVGWRSTNIGQALSGVAYAVRDERGIRLARPGASGELVILGDHLAYGYDHVEMTATRFRRCAQGRMYLTRDAVSVDEQGDLHFLGRIDRQIKRNGVLVCPEEVERAAYEAGCNEARVELEHDRLVLHYSGPLDEAQVLSYVQDALPRAFWPARLARWESLPKNVNGKLAHDFAKDA